MGICNESTKIPSLLDMSCLWRDITSSGFTKGIYWEKSVLVGNRCVDFLVTGPFLDHRPVCTRDWTRPWLSDGDPTWYLWGGDGLKHVETINQADIYKYKYAFCSSVPLLFGWLTVFEHIFRVNWENSACQSSLLTQRYMDIATGFYHKGEPWRSTINKSQLWCSPLGTRGSLDRTYSSDMLVIKLDGFPP